MEKEFNFKETGEQMPYTVPSGFFENMQEKIIRQVRIEKRKKRWLKITVTASGVAAGVAVMLFFSNLYNVKALKEEQQANITCSVKPEKNVSADSEQAIPEELDLLIEELSDEELEEMVVFSESDLFLY